MGDLSQLGKALLILGVAVAVIGLVLMAAGSIPGIGKLPGDNFIRREKISFYFPLGTSILLSVLLSLILYLFGRK
ncbi:MAG: DUF2905 domain-containing protein [Nitrospinae bacterium]|nr:DUF2905 domain-containing protein [Nitrospinota bacterium]